MNASARTDIEDRAALWLAQRDGEAWSPRDDDALQAWLAEDVAHRVAFLRLERAWKESTRLQALGAGWRGENVPPRGHWQAPPATRREQMLHAIERTRVSHRRAQGSRAAVAFAVVSVAACAVFAGWGWRAYTHVDSAHYATVIGGIETRTLADGSRTTLASDSALDVHLSRRKRLVELRHGEAIFEVAKDASRPFVVDAGARQVVAVGTRFSVRRDAHALRVVVTEGTVRLQSADGDARKPSSLLPAGSVAQIEGGNVLLRSLPLADAEQLLEWRDGLLVFRNTSLRDAAAEFNRYNARKLVIGDDEAGDLRVGGSFRWDNADAFVRLLQRGFPVQAQVAGNDIVLRSP